MENEPYVIFLPVEDQAENRNNIQKVSLKDLELRDGGSKSIIIDEEINFTTAKKKINESLKPVLPTNSKPRNTPITDKRPKKALKF